MELNITPFEVGTLNLSMRNPDTGRYLQANYYTVDGIYNDDGSLRQLSIGQLVMAICLEQATQIEAAIVEMMQGMADTITKMEVLTGLQETIINYPDENGNLYLDHPKDASGEDKYDLSQWPEKTEGYSYSDNASWSQVLTFLTEDPAGPQCQGIDGNSSAEEIVSALSTALDDLNTVNQTETIELESMTNKRDQRYDLISNVVKSFVNAMSAISNNM